MTAKLFYFHDPMCSWCWGFAPTWKQLEHKLDATFGDNLKIQYILGGLAPDSNEPMPQEMQQTLQGYWQKIHQLLGTEFNFDFWNTCQPRRSTYPACRAVIAAANQNAEKNMIQALQESYYLRALNPSNTETHLQLAQELGLALDQYKQELSSNKTEKRLKTEIDTYRTLSSNGFPSLTLQTKDKIVSIPIDYKNSDAMFDRIHAVMPQP